MGHGQLYHRVRVIKGDTHGWWSPSSGPGPAYCFSRCAERSHILARELGPSAGMWSLASSGFW